MCIIIDLKYKMKIILLLLLFSFHLTYSQCIKPASVKVLPVFFVAKDASAPTDQQKSDLIRHLKWSQSRYLELLDNRSTFPIADTIPLIYKSQQNTDYYVQNGTADNFVSELTDYTGYNRYSCPYIFLVIFMNDGNDFPTGGGRPCNGGYNTGGGVVQLSSYALSKIPRFQCTLQHELGHSFGLPHVDVYGYSMNTNMSFMSYNPLHYTDGFTPSATPGIMIPEDIRGLALNNLAFPNLEFDPQKDIPSGYTVADIVSLGIEEIPNHPYITVSTTSGSQFNTDIKNTLYTIPTATQYGNALRVDLCWLSEMLPDGWAEIFYSFQNYVFLDGLYLHTGFGANPFYHDADSVEIYNDHSGNFIRAAAKKVEAVDTYLSFNEIQTNKLKVRLKAKNDTSVCLRGIGFYYKGDDLFPPYVPYISRDPDSKLYPDVVHSLLPVNNAQVLNPLEIGFVWQTSGASLRYRLQIDTTERFCNPIDIETTDTAYIFSNASPATAYYWRVRGRNEFKYGSGEWSEIRKFTVKTSAAARDKKYSGSKIFSIVQFPDHGVFAIDVLAPVKASLRVYNVQGKLVMSLFDGTLNRGVHRYIWKSPLHGQGLYVARVHIGTNHAEKLFVMSR
jgi:hypothetical protein